MTDSSEQAREVTADEAIALVSGGTVLVDVREEHEWNAGHAPDARFLPMSEIQQRVAELPDDTQLLIICHSGARSQRVAEFLVSDGFDAVNVAGGMLAWRAAGGAVVAEPAA